MTAPASPPRPAGSAFGRSARIALFAGVLALSLGAVELVLRAGGWPRFDACTAPVDYAIPDPVLGYAAPPGGTVAGERLNAMGLRGPLPARPKPAGHRRILFLGDSTCWGLGVPLDASFAGRTTHDLDRARGAETVELLLGAFPGYSSYHSRVLLDRMVPLEPDLVVLYVGARNDPTRATYFRDAEIPARRARARAAWHQVRILRSFEAGFDRAYRSLFRKLRSQEARARVPPDAFRTNVLAMIERSREAGLPVLLVLPPIDPDFARQLPPTRGYRAILREIAIGEDVPWVDLQPAFDAAVADDEPHLYQADGYHFNERGHAVASTAITRAIESRSLLTPHPNGTATSAALPTP